MKIMEMGLEIPITAEVVRVKMKESGTTFLFIGLNILSSLV